MTALELWEQPLKFRTQGYEIFIINVTIINHEKNQKMFYSIPFI
ncbi:hypothetical protein NIES3275_37050 [Microchaete diplosiphon NIES-3275]|nr:hypothetical protein NIES3275_37050 [Microchaete diplosiphon NIES-3275]